MATIYYSSVDGNDADDGSTWALAKATAAAAVTAAGAGGTVYADDADAESAAAAITITSPGTAAAPTRLICASRASGAPPTSLATTATITTTGTNSIIIAPGFLVIYGFTFTSASGAGNANLSICASAGSTFFRAESCIFTIGTTGSSTALAIGQATSSSAKDSSIEFLNCKFRFGAVQQNMRSYGNVTFIGCTFADTGSVPTSLIAPTTAGFNVTLFSGCDLSAFGSGKNLLNVSAIPGASGIFTFRNCKMGASVSLSTGTHPGPGGPIIRLINSDSANTIGRYALQRYEGNITNESTIIRTGGANNGTAGFSFKFVSTANNTFFTPLKHYVPEEGYIFWAAAGSITVNVQTVTDNVTLQDADFWIDVEELGTASFPLSVASSSRAGILATPANLTTSSETWTTTGLATPVKQYATVTFTTQSAGWYIVRPHLAKASTTVYVCPKVDSTSIYQRISPDGAVVNSPAPASVAITWKLGPP